MERTSREKEQTLPCVTRAHKVTIGDTDSLDSNDFRLDQDQQATYTYATNHKRR